MNTRTLNTRTLNTWTLNTWTLNTWTLNTWTLERKALVLIYLFVFGTSLVGMSRIGRPGPKTDQLPGPGVFFRAELNRTDPLANLESGLLIMVVAILAASVVILVTLNFHGRGLVGILRVISLGALIFVFVSSTLAQQGLGLRQSETLRLLMRTLLMPSCGALILLVAFLLTQGPTARALLFLIVAGSLIAAITLILSTFLTAFFGF